MPSPTRASSSRLAPPQLLAEYKAQAPFGQFPLLEVDGKMLGQSNCQLRYAAAGIRPADAFEACVVDSICDQGASFLPWVVVVFVVLAVLLDS